MWTLQKINAELWRYWPSLQQLASSHVIKVRFQGSMVKIGTIFYFRAFADFNNRLSTACRVSFFGNSRSIREAFIRSFSLPQTRCKKHVNITSGLVEYNSLKTYHKWGLREY